MKSILSVLTIFALSTLLTSCATQSMKKNSDLRSKLSKQKGFICGVADSQDVESVDISLNIAMANSCEPTAPHSISYYKNDSGEPEVIFCCAASASKAALGNEPKELKDTKEIKSPTPTPPAVKPESAANTPTSVTPVPTVQKK